MDFMRAWTSDFAPDWSAREHCHPDTWEIMIVTQGSIEVNLEGHRYHGLAGSVFIYRPQRLHWEKTTSRTDLRMIGGFWKSGARNNLPEHLHDAHGRIGYTMRWICDLYDAYGPRLPVFDHLTQAVIFECRQKTDAIDDTRMERVRSYISHAAHEELTVAKLAEVACMSERHFAREFQRRTQLTPMTYVRKMRLEKASSAIAQGNLPLRQIAREVGFRDEFEFSRVFRRVMGFAPSTLRENLRRSRPKPSGE
jgi:AraC-like DNA-binding protein